MPDSESGNRLYRRSIRTSFFLVVFLVFIGGLVRSTGSGMGCPDWPKCYGVWIPPTHVSEVPEKYFSDPHTFRNGVFYFDPVNTWIEYLNRLLGVLVGFAVAFQILLSYLTKASLRSKIMGLLALVFIVGEAWVGSRVVATDLKPLIITVHYVLALFVGFGLLGALDAAQPRQTNWFSPGAGKSLRWVFVLTSLLLMVQYFLGTSVRETVDVLFARLNYASRESYVDQLGISFYIHRSFSLLVFGFMIAQAARSLMELELKHIPFGLLPLALSFLLLFSGVLLVYVDFPVLVQPIHTVLGFSIVCSQFWLLMHYSRYRYVPV